MNGFRFGSPWCCCCTNFVLISANAGRKVVARDETFGKRVWWVWTYEYGDACVNRLKSLFYGIYVMCVRWNSSTVNRFVNCTLWNCRSQRVENFQAIIAFSEFFSRCFDYFRVGGVLSLMSVLDSIMRVIFNRIILNNSMLFVYGQTGMRGRVEVTFIGFGFRLDCWLCKRLCKYV